jgi:hypothetical protein
MSDRIGFIVKVTEAGGYAAQSQTALRRCASSGGTYAK